MITITCPTAATPSRCAHLGWKSWPLFLHARKWNYRRIIIWSVWRSGGSCSTSLLIRWGISGIYPSLSVFTSPLKSLNVLTRVNTDMILDPSIVQSTEKLCRILIVLVSEVSGSVWRDLCACTLSCTVQSCYQGTLLFLYHSTRLSVISSCKL